MKKIEKLNVEPMLNVGVMEGQHLSFVVAGKKHHMTYLADDRILDETDLDSEKQEIAEFWSDVQPFTLKGVTIGKQFHWQQKEDQIFNGSLHVIAREGSLHAINVVSVEEYLKSVISSEMAATNNLELLKTHAIISRSWVLRQLQLKTSPIYINNVYVKPEFDGVLPEDVIVKWWDHDDHHLFDVCADDHCQRYQGITRQVSRLVAQAVEETCGEVLLDDEGKICDARFSKCCGGMTETFDTCWQERSFHYLQPVVCEHCNTSDSHVLRLVLNGYDQKTQDFYRWEVSYTQDEISELFERRTGLCVGKILALIPLRRGVSGRIEYLKVEGERKSVVIGKELMIRKAFSETHLYSSAFDIESDESSDNRKRFILKGKGWGHGVGLCQIGAACMSVKRFSHKEILEHYFKGVVVEKIY